MCQECVALEARQREEDREATWTRRWLYERRDDFFVVVGLQLRQAGAFKAYFHAREWWVEAEEFAALVGDDEKEQIP